MTRFVNDTWSGNVVSRLVGECGQNIDIMTCIFPLLRCYGSGEYVGIGTGCFISQRGIFVTAKHVVESVNELDETEGSIIVGVHLNADGKTGTLRGIERVFLHDSADIAIGIMKQRDISETMIIYNRKLPISLFWPNVNEKVYSITFPETLVIPQLKEKYSPNFVPQALPGRDTKDKALILPSPFESWGAIKRLYPFGRDRVMLPGPCFETDLQVYRGSSGGPVFSINGAIIGVVSTGYDDVQISYITPISEIIDIDINVFNIETASFVDIDWFIENRYIDLL